MLTEKPLHHQVRIVRVPEARVHTNADTLELLDIEGYQVVVKKSQFKAGDLAVYIQPDSVVPQTEPFRFIWEPKAPLEHGIVSGEPFHPATSAKDRRITVRKFRKEWSEGLLMPMSAFFPETDLACNCDFQWRANGITLNEGDDVSDLLGITHYEPEEESGTSSAAPKSKARRPKTLKGWLRFGYYNLLRFLSGGRLYHKETSMEVPFEAPEYDVVAMKASRHGFRPDEEVMITEKLNGSNARFLFLDGVQYIGSHFQWKALDSSNIFTRAFAQHPWIGEWCRINAGRILYGEVVGDIKGFSYGFNKSKGELGFFAFDIREPDGTWTKPWNDPKSETEPCGECELPWLNITTMVPILYHGLADMETIKNLTDSVSKLDAKTMREGIVVSELNPPALGQRRPRQVKRVSNDYLAKDSK